MSERLQNTPSGVVIGQLADIAVGGARNYVLEMRTGRFHGFVLRTSSGVHGYVDHCPHMGVPLARQLDQYLSPDGQLIMCSWHGALFHPVSGRCLGGPCRGATLSAWPVHIVGDKIVTGLGNPEPEAQRVIQPSS